MTTFTAEKTEGSPYVPVQLGLCAGGLVSTWSPDSTAPQLWSVADGTLPKVMWQGKISKVGRGPAWPNRYREAAMLDADKQHLAVTVDGENEPRKFLLGMPVDVDVKKVSQDLVGALMKALQFAADGGAKMVLLERGGLTAPREPYVLFLVENGEVVVEAKPAPHGSQLWDRVLKPGQETGLVTAPVGEQAIRQAALLFAEAARTWGVSPWDLALTYEV